MERPKTEKKRYSNELHMHLRANKWYLIMVIPGAIWAFLFCYLPMFGIIVAFKDINYTKGIFGSAWVGFSNFRFFFDTPDAWIITRNTIGYNSVFILLGIIFAVFSAVALNEIASGFSKKFYQTFMLMPYFLSWTIISYLVYAFLSKEYGFINKSIYAVLGKEQVSWYTTPKYWPLILTVVNLWKYVGYNSIVYFAAIVGINREYYEAAEIDGAGKFAQIMHITLPSLSPIIIVMLILQVGKIFNADMGLFYQVTQDSGALYGVTNVLDTYVFRALKVTGDIGMSAAAGLYQSAVGCVLVIVTNLIVKRIDADKSMF